MITRRREKKGNLLVTGRSGGKGNSFLQEGEERRVIL
jgi:hypothetical protein